MNKLVKQLRIDVGLKQKGVIKIAAYSSFENG
jgi:hypothetical protein